MSDMERFRTSTPAEAAEAVARVLGGARRRVDILSPQLDPVLYDQQPCLDTLRAMIVDAGRYASVRVLVVDVDALVARGHRMIEMSRRLSSFMSIRCLAEEDCVEPEAFLVVDDASYLYWPTGAGYQGHGRINDRGGCGRLSRLFQECWERSQPHPALRQLHL
ncbi:MAG: hypothetical protein JJU06_16390 [Ectothiorhodospiraceae bacterium]|nr:hypothetical protein [Ectothiorhodospiraceae bacterium]MCH8503028.1 hypothetical protein [Ectothiorhodospiraceae bacterium]